MPADSTPATTFAATTANGIPMWFVWDRSTRTIRYYDRRYAGRPGFTEFGQDCGPALPPDAFHPNATSGFRGWHDVAAWDVDARTCRLVGMWLMLSGFAHTALNLGNAGTVYIPALARALAQAYVDGDMPNLLVTLPFGTDIPGVQHDDGVTAIAAADLVAYLAD